MSFITKLAKSYFKPSGLLRFAPYLLIIPIIVFYSLSLTGCVSTSPAIPNIYVADLRPNTNATDAPRVRFGYFGICGIDKEGTRCQTRAGRSVDTLAESLFPALPGSDSDTTTPATSKPPSAEITDLITTAVGLQSGTFIAVLAAPAVLFVLGIAALVLFKRDIQSGAAYERPRRGAVIRRVTYGLLFGSTALVFAAALSTTQAAGALEYASTGMSHASVLIDAGTTLQVLQWITFGFSVLFAMAVPFLVGSAGGEEYKDEV